MKAKMELAGIIGMLLGALAFSAIPKAEAQGQTPAHNQFLRAQDRQAKALEDIASTLKEMKRSMR